MTGNSTDHFTRILVRQKITDIRLIWFLQGKVSVIKGVKALHIVVLCREDAVLWVYYIPFFPVRQGFSALFSKFRRTFSGFSETGEEFGAAFDVFRKACENLRPILPKGKSCNGNLTPHTPPV